MRGVDPGQVLAGQALGMTPLVLIRRVIGPQAIRTMVPALGSETVSALKNSSLASVIAVEELTLRSTQLASSTFDFFSIFFASGLMYLVLTGAVTALQLGVEILSTSTAPPPATACPASSPGAVVPRSPPRPEPRPPPKPRRTPPPHRRPPPRPRKGPRAPPPWPPPPPSSRSAPCASATAPSPCSTPSTSPCAPAR